jgi:hypothetical protein
MWSCRTRACCSPPFFGSPSAAFVNPKPQVITLTRGIGTKSQNQNLKDKNNSIKVHPKRESYTKQKDINQTKRK